MIDKVDRLKLKRVLRDEAFWVAVLPLLASLHPDMRVFLEERWELLLVLLGYLAHNGYLRGKVVKGAADVMAWDNGAVQHDPLPHPGQNIVGVIDPEESV